MVRETGLEPARRKAYAPKAYVYTNFTTRGYGCIVANLKLFRKWADICGHPDAYAKLE